MCWASKAKVKDPLLLASLLENWRSGRPRSLRAPEALKAFEAVLPALVQQVGTGQTGRLLAFWSVLFLVANLGLQIGASRLPANVTSVIMLTEVLVASIRNPVHVLQSALIGADVATMPPAVIKGLFKHILTDKGIEGFVADWEKTGQSIPTS